MIMQVDPEFLRKLDPRKSYLPTVLPPNGEESASGSRLRGHLQPPSRQTDIALPEQDSTLGALSTDELREELHRRQASESRLQATREALIEEIAELEVEISRLLGTDGGSQPAPARDLATARAAARLVTSRPKNSLNLADAIAAVVDPVTVVTPAEVAELVRNDGYVTRSKTFAQSVAGTLAKHKGFTRVGRRRYRRNS